MALIDKHQLFSSGDFASLAQTTRKALHYYDSIGLLHPVTRSVGNYRFYAATQISVVNMIRILQEFGMSLDEIAKARDLRTPEHVDSLLIAQTDNIDSKIEGLLRAKKLLLTLQKTIHSALEADTGAVTIQFHQEEAIILGNVNNYSENRSEYNALQEFYRDMRDKYPGLDINYPVWARFSKERIMRNDWRWPDLYYFFNPDGPDKRPAAMYATGYTRGGYGQTDELYRRIIRHIDANGFEISGDTYEEYPLNEFCIASEDNYLIRVMITVAQKQRASHV